jgi:hypothetical protein
MKITKCLFLAVLLVLLAAPASAATDMLTAAGITGPGTSTCPATGGGTCAAGWFSVRGASTAIVTVWKDAGTATVVLEYRPDAAGPTSTLNTWTNPTATQVSVALVPPSGNVRVRVTAIGGGGTVKAKIEAATSTGGRLW